MVIRKAAGMHQKPSKIVTSDKTRICVGLERYGEFSPWSVVDDLLEALVAIGVGFDIELDGGPCDIILRNTESILHAPDNPPQNFDTPVILFDSYDITHLPFPIAQEAAKPEVKAYLRSSSFRDPVAYLRQAQGGSYYNHVLSSSLNALAPDVTLRLSSDVIGEALKKIVVMNPVLPVLNKRHLEFIAGQLPTEERYLDVLFNDWDVMGAQSKLLNRQKFGLNIHSFSDLYQDEIYNSPRHGLHYLLYLACLFNAKVLISPWGRSGFSKIDFEALLCGTIVVKPECSNVTTWVDIYDPMHGYMQYCSPDFSDLRDTVLYILNNLGEYTGVAEEEKKVMRQYYGSPDQTILDWIGRFRKICERVLNGDSRNLGDVAASVYGIG